MQRRGMKRQRNAAESGGALLQDFHPPATNGNGGKRFHHPRPCSNKTRCSFLFSNAAVLYTGMMHTTFNKWLARRDEGFLLPDRPPLEGIPKIDTTPMTDTRRKRLHPKKVGSGPLVRIL